MRNQALIQKQNPDATFVGGYEKFKELGYNVKQGEKGLKIFIPVAVTYFLNPNTNQWNPIKQATKEEKEHIKSNNFETKQVMHFKLGTVFDISQTTCPSEDYPKLFDMGYASSEHKIVALALEQYCQHYLDCKVFTKNLNSISLKGYFHPKSNSILLSDKLNESQRMCTLAHEMGHAIMHSDSNQLTQKPIEQIEVEADAVSIMITSALGIEKIAEISESRKIHISENFKKLTSLQKEHKENILLEILENANNAFQQHITDIQRTVNQALDQPQLVKQQHDIPIPKEEPTVTFLWSDNTEMKSLSYQPFNINKAEDLLHKIDTAYIKTDNRKRDETRFKLTFGNDNRYETKDVTYMGCYIHGAKGLINHISYSNDNQLETAQSKNDIIQNEKLQGLVKDLWNAYDYNCISELEQKDTPNIELISKYYDNIENREIFFKKNGSTGKYIPKNSDKEKEKNIQMKR